MNFSNYMIKENVRYKALFVCLITCILILCYLFYSLVSEYFPDFDFQLNLNSLLIIILGILTAIFTYNNYHIQMVNNKPLITIGEIFLVSKGKTKSQVYIIVVNLGHRPAEISKTLIVCWNPKLKQNFYKNQAGIELINNSPIMLDFIKPNKLINDENSLFLIKVFYTDLNPKKNICKSFYFKLIEINGVIKKQTLSYNARIEVDKKIFEVVPQPNRFLNEHNYFLDTPKD